MKFVLSLFMTPTPNIVPLAVAAEAAGWSMVTMSDHVVNVEHPTTPYPYTPDGKRRWPEFTEFPKHPICNGVKPFAVRDEWYFNMRFRPEMKGFTPLLIASPDDKTRQGMSASPRVPYQHIVDAKGRDEVLSWAVERHDGGRGVGFTGAHAHKNWGDPNFRKFVLNEILWSAKLDVPAEGVESHVSSQDLKDNLDLK